MSNQLNLSERIELYKFFATVGFSAIVAAFCMYMLAFHPGSRRGQNDSAYFGLLGTCVALWVNPAGSRKESNVAVDSQQTTIVANKNQE